VLGKLSVEIEDPVQTGAAFVATNNGVQYSLSPAGLIITEGLTVVSTSRCRSTGPPSRRGQWNQRRHGAFPVCSTSF
jgi:hypothetical protein